MKTILLIAYACNPDKHSEHRVGFETVRALISENPDYRFLVFTRAKNVEALRARKDLNPHVIIGFDLFSWIVRLKSISGLTRLYYYVWSVIGGLFLAVWLKKRNENIDLIHHLTFVCDWLPSAAWFASRKALFIFGPIGSNDYSVAISPTFTSRLADLFKSAVRRLDFFTRLTYANANHVFFITDTVQNNASKSVTSSIYPAIGTNPIGVPPGDNVVVNRSPTLLYVGRLMEIKRPLLFCDVAKQVASQVSGLSVVLVGDGPLKNQVLRHELFNEVEGSVSLIRSVDHAACIDLIRSADILLFTSYEQAGLVGLEALECKTLFVCSEMGFLGGRREYDSRCKFPEASPNEMVADISKKIVSLLREPNLYDELVEKNYRLGREYLWDEKARFFRKKYEQLFGGIE